MAPIQPMPQIWIMTGAGCAFTSSIDGKIAWHGNSPLVSSIDNQDLAQDAYLLYPTPLRLKTVF